MSPVCPARPHSACPVTTLDQVGASHGEPNYGTPSPAAVVHHASSLGWWLLTAALVLIALALALYLRLHLGRHS